MVSIKTKGVSKLLRELKRFGDDSERVVSEVVNTTALEVAAEAKRLAPVDTGKLRQGIISQKITELSSKVESTAPYSAYMEFGTGRKVDVPDVFKSIAAQWKGKGIRQVHLMPRPFMFPAFLKGRRIFEQDLRDQLDRLVNKYE